jgi:hypothetical protein
MKRLVMSFVIVAVSALSAWPVCARILTITVTADNTYDLYVNGTYIGSQNNSDGRWGWDAPEVWVVDAGTSETTLALAAQDESAASYSGIGLILRVEGDDGITDVTDGSWRVSDLQPAGWTQPGFDDSAWEKALDEGPYNSIPWVSYASPIAAFAGSGARWIWRGTPPYGAGYGYYNSGGYQFCNFRRVLPFYGATPALRQSWGALKRRYH